MDHLLMLLVLLWSSGLQAEGSQCESTAKADIMLFVDESRSISRENYEIIKSFLTQIVSNFDIGPDKVQIGLVHYGDYPWTNWDLDTHQTKQSLLEAIANLIYRGEFTTIGPTPKSILYNFNPSRGMRADSQKIAVLMTDGKSQTDVFLDSQLLRDAGIEVYVIGVKDADKAQLRAFVSDPVEIHTYSVSNFSSLPDIIDNLNINLCNSAHSSGLQAEDKHQSTGSQCESTAKADIMLFVDESWSISLLNLKIMRSFLTQIFRNFDIGPDKVQIGLVEYGNFPLIEWQLNTHQTKQSLLEAIDNLPYGLGRAHMTGITPTSILHNFKPRRGMRADSQKIAVLITDGESQTRVFLNSQLLRTTGIEVYIIGVKDADKAQLRYIASDPVENHTYSVSNFSSILDIVGDLTINLCNSVNSSGLQAEDKHQSTGRQCESTAKADIMLLVDEYWDHKFMRSFLTQIVRNFNIGPDKVQIGLVQGKEDPMTKWQLNTHQTKQSLLEAIDDLHQRIGGTMYTGNALDFILHNFNSSRGMRADSQKIAVLITSGKYKDDVSLASQHLRDAGIEVYAVGIWNVDEAQLRSMASDHSKVFMFSDQWSILNILDIVGDLTIKLCNSVNRSGQQGAEVRSTGEH